MGVEMSEARQNDPSDCSHHSYPQHLAKPRDGSDPAVKQESGEHANADRDQRRRHRDPGQLQGSSLQADRIWPVYSHNGEELEGFEYQIGTGTIIYDKEDILHLKDFS